MGTMIHLALGKLEVDWGKNNFFKNHGALYQPTDLKQIPTYYAGEDWSDDDPIIELSEGFGKPLKEVVDRMELLGFTLPTIEQQYCELHDFHELDEQPLPFERLRQALKNVDVNGVRGNYGEDFDPGKFVRREIIDRLSLTSELDRRSLKPGHWEIDLLLENFSPYAVLRLLAQNPANLSLDVNWDFGQLVEAGWAKQDEFQPGPSSQERFLIVTEGSSDAKIIHHSLQLLKPHIRDFFQFVDMDEGYPFSGTGNLYNFTKGLVSIGILNNTIILYDNDAEGTAKLELTKKLSLPPNVRVMQLPQLSDFKNFPTEGPSGYSAEDINGRAAAIECYLDLTQHGLPEPVVRWTSFNKDLSVYQGELEHKSQYLKDFLDKREISDNYNSRKILSVLDALIRECVIVAEFKQKVNGRAPNRE